MAKNTKKAPASNVAPVAIDTPDVAPMAPAPDVAPVVVESKPADFVGPLLPAPMTYIGQKLVNGDMMDIWEHADGIREYHKVDPVETAIEKARRESAEKASAENAEYRKLYAETARLNGLSYIVSRPYCMHVRYTVVETANNADGYRIRENRTFSDFHTFSDVWNNDDAVMAPVLQAIDMLPAVESKTAVKNAVWPLARACGRAVPADKCLELLQSMRKYARETSKVNGVSVKLQSHKSVTNDVETLVIKFLSTCPELTPAK